jgi:hypothetical protein
VVLSTVWVRPPPPGPSSNVSLKSLQMVAMTGAGTVFQRSWNYLPLKLFPKFTCDVVVLTQVQLDFLGAGQRKARNGRILENKGKRAGDCSQKDGEGCPVECASSRLLAVLVLIFRVRPGWSPREFEFCPALGRRQSSSSSVSGGSYDLQRPISF